jgi:hypothetical protein
MEWRAKIINIDIETGEVLSYVKQDKDFKKKYKTIQKLKKVNYENTHRGTIEYTNLCTRRCEQLTIW